MRPLEGEGALARAVEAEELKAAGVEDGSDVAVTARQTDTQTGRGQEPRNDARAGSDARKGDAQARKGGDLGIPRFPVPSTVFLGLRDMEDLILKSSEPVKQCRSPRVASQQGQPSECINYHVWHSYIIVELGGDPSRRQYERRSQRKGHLTFCVSLASTRPTVCV